MTIAPRRHIVEHSALHTSLVLGLFSKEGGWEAAREKYSASQNHDHPASSTESSSLWKSKAVWFPSSRSSETYARELNPLAMTYCFQLIIEIPYYLFSPEPPLSWPQPENKGPCGDDVDDVH